MNNALAPPGYAGETKALWNLQRLAILAMAALLLPGCGMVITNVALFFALSTEEDEIQEVPLVSGVFPHTGPVEGGTQVTLYGALFKADAVVLFDGVPATAVTVTSSETLTCTTPPMASNRSVEVAVRNTDGFTGSLSNGFSYWWDGDWPRRWTFNVTGSTTGVLTDFQVRIVVPYDGEMKTDFSDLRLTQLEGGTEVLIPHWLEGLVVGANPPEAIVWIKVAQIPADPEITTVYAYFGNPLASSSSDFGSTFTKDFGETGLAGLWHLDEGTGFVTSDISGNGNTGVLNNMSPPQCWLSTDGGHWGGLTTVGFTAGSAQRFDGHDDFVDCGLGPSLSVLTALTLETWVKGAEGSVTGAEQVALSKWQLREDTSITAWSAFDSGREAGFFGAAFDGRYVYFVPHENNTGKHSEVVRYDTTGGFSVQGSWSSFDPDLS
ncbi:MAG: IPT/TIG domain-containing protein [Planctomycetota bacterium]|jgi:hypothetical protein